MITPIRIVKDHNQMEDAVNIVSPDMRYHNSQMDIGEICKVVTYPDVIPGRYAVSNYGNVYDIKSDKLMNTYINNKGYGRVDLNLVENSIKQSGLILKHRLVAHEFIPKTEDDIENKRSIVNHIDETPSNCDVDNLEWVNYKENSNHSVNYKDTLFNYDEITTVCQGLLQRKPFKQILTEINKPYSIETIGIISDIGNKKIYNQISDSYFKEPIRYRPRGLDEVVSINKNKINSTINNLKINVTRQYKEREISPDMFSNIYMAFITGTAKYKMYEKFNIENSQRNNMILDFIQNKISNDIKYCVSNNIKYDSNKMSLSGYEELIHIVEKYELRTTSIFTEEQVHFICKQMLTKVSFKTILNELNIEFNPNTSASLSRIALKKAYVEISDLYFAKPIRYSTIRQDSLSDEELHKVGKALEEGKSYSEICDILGWENNDNNRNNISKYAGGHRGQHILKNYNIQKRRKLIDRTEYEEQVIRYLKDGYSIKEIYDKMNHIPGTYDQIRVWIGSIKKKLNKN